MRLVSSVRSFSAMNAGSLLNMANTWLREVGAGDRARTEDGVEQGSLSAAEPETTVTTEQHVGAVLKQGAAA